MLELLSLVCYYLDMAELPRFFSDFTYPTIREMPSACGLHKAGLFKVMRCVVFSNSINSEVGLYDILPGQFLFYLSAEPIEDRFGSVHSAFLDSKGRVVYLNLGSIYALGHHEWIKNSLIRIDV